MMRLTITLAITLAATAAPSIALAGCGPAAAPPAQPATNGDSSAWGPPGSPTSAPPAGHDAHGHAQHGGAPHPGADSAPVNDGAYASPPDRPARQQPRSGPARPEPVRPAPADRDDARPSAGKPAADSMSELERAVVEEVNRMRRNPRAWAAALQRYRGYYDGRLLRLPGSEIPIQTFEGLPAVDEAIAAARAGKPLPEMRLSPGLSRAARAHAVEIGAAGSIDHTGKDGSSPFDRMKRHGRVDGMSGENIGPATPGAGDLVVIDLFVDDGVPSRGHRKNLLSPRYRVIGVGCAPHKAYGTICVMDLAEGFEER